MTQNRLRLLGRIAQGALVLAFATTCLYAQSAPAANSSGSGYDSRWDVSTLYSYLGVHGADKINPNISGTNSANSISYSSVNLGAYFGGTYFFNKNWGVEAAFANHNNGYNDGLNSIGIGPVFRFRRDNITYFFHAQGNAIDLAGPNNDALDYYNPWTWGVGATAGVGADYALPKWKFLSIRIFQADYTYNKVNFGPYNGTTSNPAGSGANMGGRASLYNAQLSTGLVWHFGSIAPPPPVTLSCSATPSEVYPGDPVTVTGTAGSLEAKASPTYTWSSTSGAVTGSGPSVTVSSKTPGSYTVTGKVSEGNKAYESASCTANFTVKPYDPPTISCSANPSTVNPGDSSTITSEARQAQNLSLTYNYSSSAGSVGGNGGSATLSTTGAPSGTVTVTCNVVASDGQTASSTTSVSIEAPPPPPGPSPEQRRLEARLALHSVFFPTAQPTAAHPEGGLVASQQATLTTLAEDFKNYLTMKPDARLTLTGHADVRGSAEFNQALTERRVDRAKQFLVAQGVPEASIDTRADGKTVELSADQVKALVQQNPDLSDADRAKVLKRLGVIVLAQNRRVDITLSTTGQQSVQLYPFNAADSMTLLNENATAPRKATKKKP